MKRLLRGIRVGLFGEVTHIPEFGERNPEGTEAFGWGPQPGRLRQLSPGLQGLQDPLLQVDSPEGDPARRGW